MDPGPRLRLAELVVRFGREDLSANPARVQGLLLDACPQARTENSLLVAVASEGIAERLASSESVFGSGDIQRAVSEMQHKRGLTPDVARWAVMSWAAALGLTMAVPDDSVEPGFTPPPPPPHTLAVTEAQPQTTISTPQAPPRRESTQTAPPQMPPPDRFVPQAPVLGGPGQTYPPPQARRRRRGSLIMVFLALLVVGGGAAGVNAWQHSRDDTSSSNSTGEATFASDSSGSTSGVLANQTSSITAASSASTGPATVTISDQLTTGAEKELVVVKFSSGEVVELFPTASAPKAAKDVSLASAGSHTYGLALRVYVLDSAGAETYRDYTGSGTIYAINDSAWSVVQDNTTLAVGLQLSG